MQDNEYQPINNDNNNNLNAPTVNAQPPMQPQPMSNPILPPEPNNQQPYPQPQQPLYQPPPQVVYQPVAQPVYGQNIIVAQPQPVVQGAIVINQNQPFIQRQIFMVSPVSMVCPFCQQQISTRVETQFNLAACCICCWIGVFYFIMQAIRGKDLCCDDARHICPNCNHEVGRYQCL